MRNETVTYDLDEQQIIATSDGMRSPRMITIDLSKVAADSNGQKYLEPDEFIANIPGSDYGRILPRDKVAEAIASGATEITVARAKNFVAGEALSVLAPMAKINIASSTTGWADADTVTVTIANYALVVTILTADLGGTLTLTNASVAAKVAAAINADPYLSKLVSALSGPGATTSSDVFVWAKDFITPYAISVADSGANGTATIGSSLTALRAGQAVGTIATGGVNTTTNKLTISAASTNLPAGMPIGVAGPMPLGLACKLFDLLKDSESVSGYIGATVYHERIRYWDGDVDRLLPGLKPLLPTYP